MGSPSQVTVVGVTVIAWGLSSLWQSLQAALAPEPVAPAAQAPVIQISPQACHCHCEVLAELPPSISSNGWWTAIGVIAAEAALGAFGVALLWGLGACRALLARVGPAPGPLALGDADRLMRGDGWKRSRSDLSHFAVDVSEL